MGPVQIHVIGVTGVGGELVVALQMMAVRVYVDDGGGSAASESPSCFFVFSSMVSCL